MTDEIRAKQIKVAQRAMRRILDTGKTSFRMEDINAALVEAGFESSSRHQ
jgi:hypothetical protein